MLWDESLNKPTLTMSLWAYFLYINQRNMKLYNFNQNNSGGSFHIGDDVTYNVLIEANNYEEANEKAEEVGIYFNGCSDGSDCSCCGDRWSTAWNDEVDEYSVYEFKDKESTIQHFDNHSKGLFRDECIIYFSDGTKERIYCKS